MNTIRFTLVFLCITFFTLPSAFGQNQNWVFGFGSGMSFCSGVPVNFNAQTQISSSAGSAAISDSACALLFYTDGITIWDYTGTPMPHGNGNLNGDNSTTQSSVIVPDPANHSRYYVFDNNASFAHPAGVLNGFTYSIVDMSLPGNGTTLVPQGDVVDSTVNTVLYKSNDSMPFYSNSRLAALAICGTHDYWIITHESSGNVATSSDTFIFYRLTASGVAFDHKQGIGTPLFGNYLGALHFSQDGSKAVSAVAGGLTGTGDLFSFDGQTGFFSDWINLIVPSSTSNQTVGAEFSPGGNFVYMTNEGNNTAVSSIFQYNITSGNAATINSSRVILDSVSLDTIPGYQGSPTTVVYFYAGLALGPDGKLYSAEEDQNFLAVINFPDSAGLACGLQRNGYQLGSGMRCKVGLPNELVTLNGVKCTTNGIQSIEANTINVYPNPSTGLCTIDQISGAFQLRVCDALGRVVLVTDIQGQNTLDIDLSHQESGIYFFQLVSDQGTIVKKMILNTSK